MANLDKTRKAAAAAVDLTEVKFDGRVWLVKPPNEWTGDAIEGINTGQVKTWARDALAGDRADIAAFGRLTVNQYVEFFAAYSDAAGQSPGESQPSQA